MSDNINEEIMNNLPDEENATDAIGASDDIEDIEDEIYTLTDEEGNEARFELAGTRELNGETYYALIPIENDKDEYVILKSEISENNEEMLVTIDDDDEFNSISEIYDNELFGEIDYDLKFSIYNRPCKSFARKVVRL